MEIYIHSNVIRDYMVIKWKGIDYRLKRNLSSTTPTICVAGIPTYVRSMESKIKGFY